MGYLLTPTQSSTQVPTWRAELDPNNAPRGLTFSLVGGNSWRDMASGAMPVVAGSPFVANTPAGRGLCPNGGILSYAFSNAPFVFSYEVYVQAAPSLAGTEHILGFNQSLAATGGNWDRAIYGSSANAYTLYVYPGGNSGEGGTHFQNGQMAHVVFTDDGTNVAVYVNGVLSNTTASGSAFNGFTNPVYLCIGNSQAANLYWHGQIMLVNMATVVWTAAEVAARYAEPFAMFRPVVQRQYFSAGIIGDTGQGVYKSGQVRSVGGTGGPVSTFAVGDTVGVAFDFDAKLWWVRTNNGTWNGSPTADPATSTEGISFADVTGPPFAPAFAWQSVTNAGATTTNFGQTSFTYTVPSGFTGFNALAAGGGIAEAIASTSSLSVSLSRTRPIAEAVASTSSQTGTIARARPIAEAVASASLQAGSITRTRPIAEAVASTSLQTGSITRRRPIAEAVASTSLQTGSITRTRPIAEAIASTSLMTTAIAKATTGVLAETIASTSLVAVTIHKIGAVAEAIASTSLLAPALARTRPIAEAITSTSLQTAAVARVKQKLVQVVASTSQVTSTLARTRPVAEAIASTSALSATINRAKPQLSEVIASTSVQTATVHKTGALNEAIPASSALTMTLGKISGSQVLSEAISSTSSVHTTIHATRAMNEAIQPVTAFVASVNRLRPAAQAIGSTTAYTVSLGRSRPMATEAINSLSAFSASQIKLKPNLAEAVASTSTVAVTLRRTRAIAQSVTSTSSYVSAAHKLGALKATYASATSFAALLARSHPIAMSVSSVSVFHATIGNIKLPIGFIPRNLLTVGSETRSLRPNTEARTIVVPKETRVLS